MSGEEHQIVWFTGGATFACHFPIGATRAGRQRLSSYYWRFDARAATPVKSIFFYGTRLREQCEQDPAFGYELMKRMAEVVINRLQAARKYLKIGVAGR